MRKLLHAEREGYFAWQTQLGWRMMFAIFAFVVAAGNLALGYATYRGLRRGRGGARGILSLFRRGRPAAHSAH